MAYEIPGFNISLVAAESMASAQFYFAKVSGDNGAAICTELTDMPCGVIQNKPASGGAAEIMVMGVTKVLVGAGGALVAGNLVGCDADGKAVAVDPDGTSDYYWVGQCLEGAAAGEYATILINAANPCIQAGS